MHALLGGFSTFYHPSTNDSQLLHLRFAGGLGGGSEVAVPSFGGRPIYGFDSNLPLTCELILSRIHPGDRAAAKADYDRASALLGTFESEHRLLLPYGKTRWVGQSRNERL